MAHSLPLSSDELMLAEMSDMNTPLSLNSTGAVPRNILVTFYEDASDFPVQLATIISSLSVCRVVLHIPRARQARLVADMLATRRTHLAMSGCSESRYIGLHPRSIHVTRPTRPISSC